MNFQIYENDVELIITSEKKNPLMRIKKILTSQALQTEFEVLDSEPHGVIESNAKVSFSHIVGLIHFNLPYLVVSRPLQSNPLYPIRNHQYHRVEQRLIPLFSPAIKAQELGEGQLNTEDELVSQFYLAQNNGDFYCSSDRNLVDLFPHNAKRDSLDSNPKGITQPPYSKSRRVFCANEFLLTSLYKFLKPSNDSSPEETKASLSDLTTELIFGHISEFELDTLSIQMISRRSRTYFGPRLLRRGLSAVKQGHAANYIETELVVCQRVAESSTKVFTTVFCRGSVPLFWSQFDALNSRPVALGWQRAAERKVVSLKQPEIVIGRNTPPYRDTERHFERVLDWHLNAYSPGPVGDKKQKIIVMSLLRDEKDAPYKFSSQNIETVLRDEYEKAVSFVSDKWGRESPNKLLEFHNINLNGKIRKKEQWARILKELQEELPLCSFFSEDFSFYSEFAVTSREESDDSEDQRAEVLIEAKGKQDIVMRINCVDSTDRTQILQGFVSSWVIRELFMAGKLSGEFSETCPFWRNLYESMGVLNQNKGNALSEHYCGSETVFSEFIKIIGCECSQEECGAKNSGIRVVRNSERFDREVRRRANFNSKMVGGLQIAYLFYFGEIEWKKNMEYLFDPKKDFGEFVEIE